jgi:hypothetical protein
VCNKTRAIVRFGEAGIVSANVANVEGDSHRIKFDDVRPQMAKADLNKVADDQKRAKFGGILRRAVELSGLIEKEAAEQLKADRGQFSRWLSGQENAQVWKFFADELLGPCLLAAMAEETPGATIRQVIELQRKVG